MKKLTAFAVSLFLIASLLMPVSAESVPAEFYVKQVSAEDGVLTAELRLAVYGDTEINSFGMSVDYDPAALCLTACTPAATGGMCITSQYIDENPYLVFWVGGPVALTEGDHCIATMVFDILTDTVPEGAVITISADDENPPRDMDGADLEDAVTDSDFIPEEKAVSLISLPTVTTYEIGESPDLTGGMLLVTYYGSESRTETVPFTEEMISGYDPAVYGTQTVTVTYEGFTCSYEVRVTAIPGDADRSGDVALKDASLILRHIAGWEVPAVDLEAADVNDSGDVNLFDVSLILRYVANWEVELK